MASGGCSLGAALGLLIAVVSPGDLPHPGIEHTSPTLQAESLPLSHQGNFFFFCSKKKKKIKYLFEKTRQVPLNKGDNP